MLRLSRRAGQGVVIETPDGPVLVRVMGWQNGTVRFAFEAPDRVRILREELLQKAPRPAGGVVAGNREGRLTAAEGGG